jgi:choline dehydrogenase-like flavoprotein
MHPFSTNVLIVGAGACGALVAKELAQHGISVVVLEAGNRWRAATDFANSDANAGRIIWNAPRNHVGADFIVPKTGVGVGGGTLSRQSTTPRASRSAWWPGSPRRTIR